MARGRPWWVMPLASNGLALGLGGLGILAGEFVTLVSPQNVPAAHAFAFLCHAIVSAQLVVFVITTLALHMHPLFDKVGHRRRTNTGVHVNRSNATRTKSSLPTSTTCNRAVCAKPPSTHAPSGKCLNAPNAHTAIAEPNKSPPKSVLELTAATACVASDHTLTDKPAISSSVIAATSGSSLTASSLSARAPSPSETTTTGSASWSASLATSPSAASSGSLSTGIPRCACDCDCVHEGNRSLWRDSRFLAPVSTGPMAVATVCASLVRLNVLAATLVWTLGLICSFCIFCLFVLAVFHEGRLHLARSLRTTNNVAVVTRPSTTPTPPSITPAMSPAAPAPSPSTLTPPPPSRWQTTCSAFLQYPWSPAAFPPTVGITVFASASPGLGVRFVATVLFVHGVVWAFVVLVLCVRAWLPHRKIPKRLSSAILCAPFSLCGAAFWAVCRQYQITPPSASLVFVLGLLQCLLFTAVLLWLVVLLHLPTWRPVMYAPQTSALTFPTVISATFLVRSMGPAGGNRVALSAYLFPAWGLELNRVLSYVAVCVAVLVCACVMVQYLAALVRHAANCIRAWQRSRAMKPVIPVDPGRADSVAHESPTTTYIRVATHAPPPENPGTLQASLALCWFCRLRFGKHSPQTTQRGLLHTATD